MQRIGLVHLEDAIVVVQPEAVGLRSQGDQLNPRLLAAFKVTRVGNGGRHVLQKHGGGRRTERQHHAPVLHGKRTPVVEEIDGKRARRIGADANRHVRLRAQVPADKHLYRLAAAHARKPVDLPARPLVDAFLRTQPLEARRETRKSRKRRARVEVARHHAVALLSVEGAETRCPQVVPDVVYAAVGPGEEDLLPDALGHARLAGPRHRLGRLVRIPVHAVDAARLAPGEELGEAATIFAVGAVLVDGMRVAEGASLRHQPLLHVPLRPVRNDVGMDHRPPVGNHLRGRTAGLDALVHLALYRDRLVGREPFGSDEVQLVARLIPGDARTVSRRYLLAEAAVDPGARRRGPQRRNVLGVAVPLVHRPLGRVVYDRVHRQAVQLEEFEIAVGLSPVEDALLRLDRDESSPDTCPDDLRPRLHEGLQALLVVRVRIPRHVVVEAGAEHARRRRRRDHAPPDDGKARLGDGLGRLGLQRGLGEPRPLHERPPYRQSTAAVRREVARRLQRKGRSAETGDADRSP